MIAVVIAVALLVGLSLGALGGGGSILTVPALVYLLDQSAHAATTGSLLIVGVTALAGAALHAHAGRVRVGLGLTFGLLGVAGSVVGSHLSAKVDQDVLLAGFAVLMLVAATALHRQAGQDGTEGASPTDAPAPLRHAPVLAVKVVVAATVVGLMTGFFGVGGGFVIVPALVLALGVEMPVAVGTSLLVIALNSAAALAARAGSSVDLDWTLLGTFTAIAIVGTLVGTKVASRVPAARLTGAFTLLLVAVAAYTGVRSVPALL